MKYFPGLELPQRAVLILFYTTPRSIKIARVLHAMKDEVVAVIARRKANLLYLTDRAQAANLSALEKEA
jgi:hypothetical protein